MRVMGTSVDVVSDPERLTQTVAVSFSRTVTFIPEPIIIPSPMKVGADREREREGVKIKSLHDYSSLLFESRISSTVDIGLPGCRPLSPGLTVNVAPSVAS